jgi:hypothetical protein
MTIGVGFRCVDAIVIASDTQVTFGGSHKYYEEKIFEFVGPNYSWSAIFNYGGLPDLMRRFAGEFGDATHQIQITSISDLTNVIKTVFVDRIFPSVAGFDSEKLSMIGGLCVNGQLSMIKTRGENLLPARDYEYVGIGDSSLIRFLSRILCDANHQDFRSEQAALLATYLVYQAKKWVDDCGGETNLRILWPHGHRDLRDGMTKELENNMERIEERLAVAASLSFDRRAPSMIVAQNRDIVIEMLKEGHAT